MLTTAIKAILGISVILGGWLLVQLAWRRVFPGIPPGEDVLANRIGCHQCSCATPCDNARDSNSDPNSSSSINPTERSAK